MSFWYYEWRIPILLVQSILGMGVFGYALKRRERYALRLTVLSLAAFGVACAYRFLLFPDPEALHFGYGRYLASVVVFALLILIAWLSYNESVWTAMFVASSGYIAQDIAGSLKLWLRVVPFIDTLANDPLGIIAVDILVYFSVYALMYFIFRPFTREPEERFDSKLKAVFSVLVIVFTIIMAVLTQGDPERNAMAQAAESIYQMICGVFILLLQFGVMERAKLELSIGAMRELAHEQYEQYRHSKQSVELVNEKYHDLKGLLENFSGDFSREQLESLKKRLEEYNIHVDTGSRALDIVIAEKTMLCQKRGIELTSFADGHGLEFIEELDLYSVVGNALNNAIDAVSKLPEGERFISMRARLDGDMFTLHVENPYSGELVMENDLPRSQRDRRYHGFGMKSMERTVEKYGGTLSVEAEDGIFSLDAILMRQ